MKVLHTNREVIDMLRLYIFRHCNNSQRAFARKQGVSASFVSKVLLEQTPVPERFADLFGLTKKTVFIEQPTKTKEKG